MKRILAACVLLLVGVCASAQVNGQGGVYINGVLQGGGGGAGTVTSVGLSLPPFMNVSGTPITTSGTFLAGLANVSAGAVFAGPTSGADAEPDFRALLGTDLPIGLAFTDPTTDAAPISTLLKSANAFPGATSNTAGANTILAGGIGKRILTVVNYAHGSMAGSTVTITKNGGSYELIEGEIWLAATSNAATATSLANAISTGLGAYGFSATASGADVRIVPPVDAYSVTIAKSAADAGMTATSGTDGVVKAGKDLGIADIAGLRFADIGGGDWKIYGSTLSGVYPGPFADFNQGAVGSYGATLTLYSSSFGNTTIGGSSRLGGGQYGGVYFSNSYLAVGWEGGPYIGKNALGDVEVTTGSVVASTAITAVGTAAANGYIRTGVYKRAWTNAEVTAFGAVLSGDLKVATLPAKTIVRNAYLVIDSQASGTTTLTASLGRTSTAYVDYIVASDAKVAANTVYGDVVGERGTNLTGYDLPAYAATTDVYVQFVATDITNKLADVLGCTGTVYIATEVLP